MRWDFASLCPKESITGGRKLQEARPNAHKLTCRYYMYARRLCLFRAKQCALVLDKQEERGGSVAAAAKKGGLPRAQLVV